MKKLLILGAGIYQVPLIKKANEMNIYTVVVSIPGHYPGFSFAKKVYYENTIDKVAVLKIALEEKVDGVAVCGTDVCVPTQGYICDRLHLFGPSEQSARLAQNKALMKQAFIANGTRTAQAQYLDISNNNPIDVCKDLGYPVIFKSVDSSGSRGITKVNEASEIPVAYQNVRKNTHDSVYLIEKYLVGKEFGAQAFVYNGKIKMFLPHGDYVYHGDTGVPIGHYAPIDMGQEVIEDATIQLENAISALGIDNCAINADFILCDGKTYVLEIGARAGATCLVEMTSIYYGFDYYEKIIQAALGIEPDFTPKNEKRQPNAEMLVMASRSGVLGSVELSGKDDPRIVDISMDYVEGDKVRKFEKGPDRIGQVIAIGNTVAEAKEAIDELLSQCRIVIREN